MTTKFLDWVKALTPIVILTIGGIAGWIKMSAQVDATVAALDAECVRAKEADKAMDRTQRVMELSIARIQSDVTHINDSLKRIENSNSELLRELRNR